MRDEPYSDVPSIIDGLLNPLARLCVNSRAELGAVHMSPVNRASSGHEILSSAAKEDLNLR